MISVVHSVGRFDLEAGGTSQLIGRLCQSLAEVDDLEITLASQIEARQTPVALQLANVDVHIQETRFRQWARLGFPFRKSFARALSKGSPSILHAHGIWTLPNHHVAAVAKRCAIPFVVHPHGMLKPWALAYRGWKKRLALRLYQRRDLEMAKLFFVTSTQEAEDVRLLGLRQPLAIIPNGVKLPRLVDTRTPRTTAVPSTRNVLFLGRIHSVKGVLNLVEAWGRLRPVDWRLRLAGPDDGRHLATVMQRVRELKLDDSIEYLGIVDGDRKAALFRSADLFVLPSYSENFGLVVAEALACGIPVITTTGTPWEGLVSKRCGWWIAPSADALAGALHEAFALDYSILQEMGARGRAYAGEFSWETIAHQTAEVYRWVLGQGPHPPCVVVN